ncbi:DUF3153 domain-containing protein [Leptolyngbya sp. FACHB-36]|nr:DUF3153 domain-containing protein [Leptolyngbya sp. FACHB-36]
MAAVPRWFKRVKTVCLLLLASLVLSGCVQYDVGVRFKSPQQGEIVQHIQVGERLRSLSDATVRQWLSTIEQRSRQVGGRVLRRSAQDLMVRIPFSNGADLEAKFNQFFGPATEARGTATPDLPDIESHLSLSRSNLLLLERNRLAYDLDLRSLGVSSNGTVILSPTELVDLEFRLEAPWGARTTRESIAATRQGQQLVWQLTPGEVNHLEAVFWMPNPLGIGTVAIVLLVIGGQALKPRSQPASVSQNASP